MTRRTPLNVREWLEDMYQFNGRDADRARELLDGWREIDDEDVLAYILDGYQRGTYGKDADEIIDRLDEHEALVALLENDPFASEIGDADDQVAHLQAVLDKAREDDAFRWSIQDLLIDADVLEPTDYTSDPIPLLRMFLPCSQ